MALICIDGENDRKKRFIIIIIEKEAIFVCELIPALILSLRFGDRYRFLFLPFTEWKNEARRKWVAPNGQRGEERSRFNVDKWYARSRFSHTHNTARHWRRDMLPTTDFFPAGGLVRWSIHIQSNVGKRKSPHKRSKRMQKIALATIAAMYYGATDRLLLLSLSLPQSLLSSNQDNYQLPISHWETKWSRGERCLNEGKEREREEHNIVLLLLAFYGVTIINPLRKLRAWCPFNLWLSMDGWMGENFSIFNFFSSFEYFGWKKILEIFGSLIIGVMAW